MKPLLEKIPKYSTVLRTCEQNVRQVLENIQPMFSFFIQKVEKSIQKYSRGKSGKYFLI